jgi:outer membrane protein assembly factor BamB/tetratricopeptide (TPR) repeat protein
MGFQGTIESVNIADIFQTLAMNGQTGTLIVHGPDRRRFVWFASGSVILCDGGESDGMPMLLRTLTIHGFLNQTQAEQLLFRCNNSRQPLRDLIVASSLIPTQNLDELCSGLIEDLVCEIFEWSTGEFEFVDGDPVPELIGPQVIALGDIPLQTSALIMEATRRQDEWARIREAIPDSNELFVVDNEGRTNLAQIETDPDMLKVLRYLDGKHLIDQIAEHAGLSRFDCHAIVAQLVLSHVVRLRSGEEIVEDALALREEGHLNQATNLLRNALKRIRTPEVLLPLAELNVEQRLIPQAVELYLELVQHYQEEQDFESALHHLNTLIDLSPDDPELRIDRATLLIELEQLDDAAEAYINAANDYLNLRDTNAAIESCHRARDLQPRAAEPHRLLAKAYLLDGQTDNAVVEYKSLWHAMLPEMRPRKALNQLEQILAEDCKYPAVTEQVLNHAKGSEAVKTASAVRMLVYTIIIILVAVAGFLVKNYIDKHVILQNAEGRLQQLQAQFDNSQNPDFNELSNRLDKLRDFTRDSEYIAALNRLQARIQQTQIEHAHKQQSLVEQYLTAGKYDQAEAALQVLRDQFRSIEGITIDEFQKRLDYGKARAAIDEEWRQAQALWNEYSWSEALTSLNTLIAATKNPPPQLKQEMEEQRLDWQEKLQSAEHLFRRAEQIELRQGKRPAIDAFVTATKGQGDRFVTLARERLLELENRTATELAKTIAKSARNQDAENTFGSLDELRNLVKNAHSMKPQEILNTIQLPMVVNLDSHNVSLFVKPSGGGEQVILAPSGVQGAWSHTLYYPAISAITIGARRSGFSTIEDIRIDSTLRRLQYDISLQRGPSWQISLPAIPIADAQLSGGSAIFALRNNSLHIVNIEHGTNHNIAVAEDIGVMVGPPLIFRSIAYVVLGDRIVALDINTRLETWTWPPVDDPTFATSFAGPLWAQEHELIQNEIQIFAGTTNGQVITLAVQDDTAINPYPRTKLGWAITGPIYAESYEGIHSTVYVPAGQYLVAYDATSVSQNSELKYRFKIETRGEIPCRPIRANVGSRPSLLIVDSAGAVIAIDADPTVHGSPVETLGSWPVENGLMTQPSINAARRQAVVNARGGQVLALDIAKPGDIAWRYPTSGTLGDLVGSPAIGKHGIYVADTNGMLTCLDQATGAKLWEYDLGGSAAAGALAADGRVLVATTGGSLLCFEESEP